ncbi:Small ribosomal subunit assembling AARP2 protein [Balamuthia mandrillaris]
MGRARNKRGGGGGGGAKTPATNGAPVELVVASSASVQKKEKKNQMTNNDKKRKRDEPRSQAIDNKDKQQRRYEDEKGALKAAANFIERVQANPEVFVTASSELDSELTLLTKNLFDFAKRTEPQTKNVSFGPLEELLVEGFDTEQIWEQMQLQHEPLLQYLQQQLKRWLKEIKKNGGKLDSFFPRLEHEVKESELDEEEEEEDEEEGMRQIAEEKELLRQVLKDGEGDENDDDEEENVHDDYDNEEVQEGEDDQLAMMEEEAFLSDLDDEDEEEDDEEDEGEGLSENLMKSVRPEVIKKYNSMNAEERLQFLMQQRQQILSKLNDGEGEDDEDLLPNDKKNKKKKKEEVGGGIMYSDFFNEPFDAKAVAAKEAALFMNDDDVGAEEGDSDVDVDEEEAFFSVLSAQKKKNKKKNKKNDEEDDEDDDDEEEDEDENEEEDEDLAEFMGADKGEENDEEVEGFSFQQFLQQTEAWENADGEQEEDDDDEEADEDEDDSEEEDGETTNQQPAAKKGPLSTYERAQLNLQKRIERLEEKNVAPKAWALSGEVNSKQRPQNSLLAANLEFEGATKLKPVITEEVTQTIEEVIKQRILEESWDDVVRQVEPEQKERRPTVELDFEKSGKGLAEEYEEEWRRQTQEQKQTMMEEETLTPGQLEIQRLFKSLCFKLDSLSNFHYTPKPPVEDLTVKPNLPAINMEEIIPIGVSDASLLAPEEVYEKPQKEVKGEDERTQEERKAARRSKKARRRKAQRQKQQDEKLVKKLNPGLGNKHTVQSALDQLKNARNVTIANTSQPSKSTTQSSKLFKQLQEEARAAVRGEKADFLSEKTAKQRVSNKDVAHLKL